MVPKAFQYNFFLIDPFFLTGCVISTVFSQFFISLLFLFNLIFSHARNWCRHFIKVDCFFNSFGLDRFSPGCEFLCFGQRFHISHSLVFPGPSQRWACFQSSTISPHSFSPILAIYTLYCQSTHLHSFGQSKCLGALRCSF